MLVVAIAPGFTSEFISGPPRTFWDSSMETIELNRIPVASTPMVFAIASGPCSSSDLRQREDLGDRLDRDLGLHVAHGVDLAVGRDERDPVDVRVHLGERRDVVRVLAFLQSLILGVRRLQSGFDLGRRLRLRRPRGKRRKSQSSRYPFRLHYCPPNP